VSRFRLDQHRRHWPRALILQALGKASVGTSTFPPYRTPNFVWLRYVLGGLMFGVGMTLASGCGNKMLVRLGGGNAAFAR